MKEDVRKILHEYARWNLELAEEGGNARGLIEVENKFIDRILVASATTELDLFAEFLDRWGDRGISRASLIGYVNVRRSALSPAVSS
jgi:hypothetical protein